MNRDDFMKEARVTARDILQGKEHQVIDDLARAFVDARRNTCTD